MEEEPAENLVFPEELSEEQSQMQEDKAVENPLPVADEPIQIPSSQILLKDNGLPEPVDDFHEEQQEEREEDIYIDSIECMMNALKMDQEEFQLYLKPASEPVIKMEEPSVIEGEDLLYDLVTKNATSIFVETNDLVCEQAINILKSLSLPLYVVRLDKIDNGNNVKEVLFETTGRKELPVIFIKGQVIGGYENLWYLYFTHLITYLFDERHTPFENNFSFGYELVVIGGGTAGISAAFADVISEFTHLPLQEAAKLGKKVAIVNYVQPTMHGRAWEIGGTSINAGSITKNLLFSASNYGNILEEYEIDEVKSEIPPWEKLINNICEHIKTINFSIRCQLKEAGIESFNAKAKFQTSHVIELSFPGTGEKKTITSSVTIVATGSHPRYPRYIQGPKEHCYTTVDFFRCGNSPGKTLILTSTYVGLECATILANFSFPVTLVVEPPILKQIDWEILRRVKSHLRLKGVKFLENVLIESIEPNTDPEIQSRLKVIGLSENKQRFEDYFDTVLFEFGQVPNTSHLGLCKIGVKVHTRSRKILTDEEGRSSIKHIFAIGDVLHGVPELASVSRKTGKILVDKIYKGIIKDIGLSFVPEKIILPVEYAFVGRTEQSALAQFGSRVKSYDAESHYIGHISRQPIKDNVYMKIVCLQHEEKEEVIGIHMLCNGSAEIIQGLSISLRNGLTKLELDEILALHAIFCEVIANLKLEPVQTPMDVNKVMKDKSRIKAVEKALEEVKGMRGKEKPPVPDFPLDERDETESEKEIEIMKNKKALTPRLKGIPAKDVNVPVAPQSVNLSSHESSSIGSSSSSSSTTTSTTTSTTSSSSSFLISGELSEEEESKHGITEEEVEIAQDEESEEIGNAIQEVEEEQLGEE